MRNEDSDPQFIEWTKNRSINSYENFFTIGVLNKLQKTNELLGLDIGGGCGKFSLDIINGTDYIVEVIDPSLQAKENFFSNKNLKLISQDFMQYPIEKKYDFIFLNLVLHHVIGNNEIENRIAQLSFLEKAKKHLKPDGILFIQENYYEGILGSDITGKIIYKLTRSKFLEKLIRLLGANTAGEGVRFRSSRSWEILFKKVGLVKISEASATKWGAKIKFFEKLFLLMNRRYQSMSIFKAIN